jgi:hypothetical protein
LPLAVIINLRPILWRAALVPLQFRATRVVRSGSFVTVSSDSVVAINFRSRRKRISLGGVVPGSTLRAQRRRTMHSLDKPIGPRETSTCMASVSLPKRTSETCSLTSCRKRWSEGLLRYCRPFETLRVRRTAPGGDAVRSTFGRRRTTIPTESPVAFTSTFTARPHQGIGQRIPSGRRVALSDTAERSLRFRY